MLQGKTRVLVTHAIDYVHLVDRVILIEDGNIVVDGHYNEINDNPHLVKLIQIHNANKKTGEENKPQKKKEEAQKTAKVAEKKDKGEKKASGKLTKDEEKEVIKVDYNSYKQYLSQCGGLFWFIRVNFWSIAYVLVKLMCDYMVGSWAENEDQHTHYWQYFWLYVAFLFGLILTIFMRFGMCADGGVTCVRELHQ